MGCISSQPSVPMNGGSDTSPTRGLSSPQDKGKGHVHHASKNKDKGAFEFIEELTQQKPVDASDVVDIQAAKHEIMEIRKHAQRFITSMSALEGSIADMTGGEMFKETNRGALYDKQDFQSYRKQSYPKSEAVQAVIYDAIRPNALFENDEEAELVELIDLFKPVQKKAGSVVIKQGEKGDTFYVVESGELSIKVTTGRGKEVSEMNCGTYSKGAAFGELALIFDSPRAATITATTDVKLWSLDRQAYRLRIGQLRFKEREEMVNFIRRCTIRGRSFCDLFDGSQIEDLSIVIKTDRYKKGTVVLREGEVNDTLYIIRSGSVNRFKRAREDKLGIVSQGQAFGTNALLNITTSPETYVAATDLVLYYLTHSDFESMIGTMQDVLDGKSITRSMIKSSRETLRTSATVDQRYTDISLSDLDFFNVLGRGAFGRVILVQSHQGRSKKKLFALKAQSKHYILKKGQTEHVLNEYRIMKKLDHPNILNIHCALQDDRYLFFVLDLHPGGELMLYLMKRKRFPEFITQFYAASVLLAFEELHADLIAYRDLKPENVMLNREGFAVLVDFGLAKEIDEGHTYTFCGTPDYLAPEIIRGTGHDWAVDYWELGVFMFELTNGCAPFYATNQSRRTRKILKGYEFVDVPPHFSRGLKDLLVQLLTNNPAKRLGRSQGGIQAIKKHIFFAGFDWQGLLEQKIKAPIQPSIPDDLKMLGKPHLNEDIFAASNPTPEVAWWPDLEKVIAEEM